MKNEIKIILKEGESNKATGTCFETLIRNLLSIHQYEIKQNIRFTGMEIDLLANHKHKTNEVLYVECKAKNRVSSIELRTFFSNVFHRNATHGYFFRTNELEYDAGGLLEEYRSDSRYDHLTFFEPKDIIQMLIDARLIYEPSKQIADFTISKRILAVTHFGDFLVYLVNESNALPTSFILVNAKNNELPVSKELIADLKNLIVEIKDLDFLVNTIKNIQERKKAQTKQLETISEVQESENWYDYLPASSERNHFVGRDEIRTSILSYFKEIRNGSSDKRIFYLNGKSGWGKSSLVLEIRGRCQNKHYKRKFYALAIDTRSAISDNFVALSMKKLVNKALDAKFIERDMFTKELTFASNSDVLSSSSMNSIFKDLKAQNKFLVLIFDQFEDVFRKKNFFETFYKFLTDVTDTKPNLIVGFSWKTDFFVQSSDPSYHIWQQAREQAREFTISEFGEKEIEGIIKQLEGSVGQLSKSLWNRIIESSQGLPWLTKKLCIHLYDQIQSGLGKEDLIESNLNISELFSKDEERLEPSEHKAIKIIAKRAYEGKFVDESEIGDLIEGSVVDSLLHKRLIIRSGANYNIYWDIYRDYLVTNEIPTIGESYLLRQGVNLCLDVFLLFEKGANETIESLLQKHPKAIGSETLNNILIELRNLGIVQKDGESYAIIGSVNTSKAGFIKYITTKFRNYTPYLLLSKIETPYITKQDVIEVLKRVFKTDFQDNTWDAYAKNLIQWIRLSELRLKSRFVSQDKGRTMQPITKSDLEDILPKSSLSEVLSSLPLLIIEPSSISRRFFREFLMAGVIDYNKELTDFGSDLLLTRNENERKELLRHKILGLPKMKKLKEIVENNPKAKIQDILSIAPDSFFDGKKQSSQVIYASKAVTWIK